MLIKRYIFIGYSTKKIETINYGHKSTTFFLKKQKIKKKE